MNKFKTVFKLKFKKDKALYVRSSEHEYNFKVVEIHNNVTDALLDLTITKYRMLKLSVLFATGTTMIGAALSWLLKLFV
ncbi:hypothetical protein [Bacillus thuringiensis]